MHSVPDNYLIFNVEKRIYCYLISNVINNVFRSQVLCIPIRIIAWYNIVKQMNKKNLEKTIEFPDQNNNLVGLRESVRISIRKYEKITSYPKNTG